MLLTYDFHYKDLLYAYQIKLKANTCDSFLYRYGTVYRSYHICFMHTRQDFSKHCTKDDSPYTLTLVSHTNVLMIPVQMNEHTLLPARCQRRLEQRKDLPKLSEQILGHGKWSKFP